MKLRAIRLLPGLILKGKQQGKTKAVYRIEIAKIARMTKINEEMLVALDAHLFFPGLPWYYLLKVAIDGFSAEDRTHCLKSQYLLFINGGQNDLLLSMYWGGLPLWKSAKSS